MPHSRNPLSYPPFFHNIASLRGGELPLIVASDSRRAAERTRFLWYGFLGALRAQANPLAATASLLEVTILELPSGAAELHFNERASTDAQAFNSALAARGLLRTPEQIVNVSLTPKERERLARDLARIDALATTTAPSETIMETLARTPTDPLPLKTEVETLAMKEWDEKVAQENKLKLLWIEAIEMNRERDAARPRGKASLGAQKLVRELLAKTNTPTQPQDTPTDSEPPLFNYGAAKKPQPVEDK